MIRLRSPSHRHLITMVVLVIVLDAVAIGVYHLAALQSASQGMRNAFTAAWTLATLVIVGVNLRRIRRERSRR